jgi:lambda family phage portal protein
MTTAAIVPFYNAARVADKGSVVLRNWLGQQPGNGFARAGVPFPRARIARGYNAAQVNRLTAGWSSTISSANSDIFRSLDILRARSRTLAQNDEYVKKWLQMVVTNVIGPVGFRFQSRVYDPATKANEAPKPDQLANDALETAWAKWCKAADVTGRADFTGLCHLMIKAAARDGEILARWVRGKDADNPFGIALQLLDINRLDTNHNRSEGQGVTQIRMGVELNAWGRPTHYWLRTRNPGDVYNVAQGQTQSMHERVPAADIIHAFISDDPEQVRGVPWAHAAMERLNNRGAFEHAAIIAARVGASKMGFFTTPDGGAEPISTGEETDSNGDPQLVSEADPGTMEVLPEGYDFKSFDPAYPSDMFGEFIKANLRGTASGLLVAYHSLANDLEGVNFSSIRSGTLEERDCWIVMQEWFRQAVLDRVHAEVHAATLSFGQAVMPNGSALPLAKRDKFEPHLFQGRRWDWVDPKKDIEADLLAIDGGLKSPQSVAAKLGLDYEDLLAEIKAAADMRKRMGVELPDRHNQQQQQKPADPQDGDAAV